MTTNTTTPAWTPLRYYREQASLSQRELARLAGLTQATVHKAERTQELRPSTRRKLAAALGIAPAQLLDRRVTPEPTPRRGVDLAEEARRLGLPQLAADIEAAV
jgi:transcriptional regulator with XRE-family HTH domain